MIAMDGGAFLDHGRRRGERPPMTREQRAFAAALVEFLDMTVATYLAGRSIVEATAVLKKRRRDNAGRKRSRI